MERIWLKEYLKENRSCWGNFFVLCWMISVKAVIDDE